MSPHKVTKPLDIYVRVSDVRGRSGESFISPKDQEERCRALATARGYLVGEVFTDLDVSGGKMRRPELDKAIARIEDGTSGGIIVAKLDRFARTLIGGLQTLEQISGLGGAVIVADGKFDTSTATGELVLNMMLSLAQFELRRIRETWQSSKRHAVANGIHISRHSPPGYRRGKDRRLELDPKTADAIRAAFERAAEGEPYARIADYLSGSGVQTTSNRVRRLLANRAYLGEARNGHGDVNREAHPALVDSATWSLAQRQRAETPTLGKNGSYLLAGLVRCASCSFAMRPQAARGSTVAAYRCTTTTKHGRCPGPSTISANRLEDYVVDEFAKRILAAPSVAPEPPDNSNALAAIEDARQAYAEVEALKGSLRPAAYGAALNDALETLEQAEAALTVARPTVAEMMPEAIALFEQKMKCVRAGERPLSLTPEGTALLRESLASEILAVFVRPAASRSKSLPISDRVKVVYVGEDVELPRRGANFEPRPYQW